MWGGGLEEGINLGFFRQNSFPPSDSVSTSFNFRVTNCWRCTINLAAEKKISGRKNQSELFGTFERIERKSRYNEKGVKEYAQRLEHAAYLISPLLKVRNIQFLDVTATPPPPPSRHGRRNHLALNSVRIWFSLLTRLSGTKSSAKRIESDFFL